MRRSLLLVLAVLISTPGYTTFRRLEARNDRFKAHGWMEACVDLDVERGWSFRIVREGGSSYIRKKVLRKALEGEREMIARGDPGRAALSLANYATSVWPAARSSASPTSICPSTARRSAMRWFRQRPRV